MENDVFKTHLIAEVVYIYNKLALFNCYVEVGPQIIVLTFKQSYKIQNVM